jgi:hypothetical protein
MINSKNELSKDNMNTRIGVGMGTALTLGMAILLARRNFIIGMAVAFMVGGIIVLYKRRRMGKTGR